MPTCPNDFKTPASRPTLLSFTAVIKKELTQLTRHPCCVKAELAAFIKLGSTLSLKPPNLIITTENAAIARHIFKSVKHFFNLTPQLLVGRRMQLKKNRFYQLNITTNVFSNLKKLLLEPTKPFSPTEVKTKLFQNICCKQAYLRGSFLATGSINKPSSTSYHLELTTTYENHAKLLMELMQSFNLKPKLLARKKGFVTYLKEGDKIGDFLKIIGAHPSLFTFENIRIMKDMKNSVNRLMNCETANLNKTITSALRQKKEILLIREKLGLEKLPHHLHEVALLRLKHPELPLGQLGQLLKVAKSKSTINYRMQKIAEIAKKLKE
jgi:DNA-binding protein WhiA